MDTLRALVRLKWHLAAVTNNQEAEPLKLGSQAEPGNQNKSKRLFLRMVKFIFNF